MKQGIQNLVKRALKAGRPTSGAWPHLCSPTRERGDRMVTLGSDASLVIQASSALAKSCREQIHG